MRKVTKLPARIDPDKLIQQEIDKRFGRCPFCDCNIYSREVDRWFGQQNEHDDFTYYHSVWQADRRDGTMLKHIINRLRSREPDHKWAVAKYRCGKCGAEWQSEPYRTDISKEAVADLWVQ